MVHFQIMPISNNLCIVKYNVKVYPSPFQEGQKAENFQIVLSTESTQNHQPRKDLVSLGKLAA